MLHGKGGGNLTNLFFTAVKLFTTNPKGKFLAYNVKFSCHEILKNISQKRFNPNSSLIKKNLVCFNNSSYLLEWQPKLGCNPSKQPIQKTRVV